MTKMSTVNDIRTAFTDYFVSKGHTHVASSPLVPQNDPTLMFANSGMVQFKNAFTGTETRDYKRATTAQKCVRAGGKHNDLENVGYTARHHTFFEMLGNFSFGDYFKEDAIPYAWEMITKVYGLPKDKLLVTVYHDDDEAANLWKKVAGLSDDRIIRIATSDNFWMMGDTGPCGPCSEIFYDHGDHIFGGPPGSPDEDGDRFIEIWNLVFMQFEQEPDGQGGYKRKPLPKPSIDTGMGLERISAILQGVHSNYEIDVMMAIINAVSDLTGQKEVASHRVIADHLRAAAFLIADGVLPSNEGRGYVLRRIMRRGMRHAHLLGAKEPLMHKLLPVLESNMGQAYPELTRARGLISETMKLEESRFRQTLERGLKLLDDEAEGLKQGDTFNGETAFKLYDTYGFPLDLTQDVLRAREIKVDTDAFNGAMAKQKAEARKSWSGSGEQASSKLWFELEDKTGATEFLGYAQEEAEGELRAIVHKNESADTLAQGQEAMLVFNQTPFYAESGGQVGDHGMIKFANGAVFKVTDTQKYIGKIFAHHGVLEQGSVKLGDAATLTVDHDRRQNIRVHHSVTHLLHAALHDILGSGVTQKGSLQDVGRTRFDVAYNKPMTPEEIASIENLVNAAIRHNSLVETRLMPIEEARATGAMALFGEKYDDEVRVVMMGPEKEGKQWSIELCGGTHVGRTGEIGAFRILSESAVSSGVRRIEALAGSAAQALAAQEAALVSQLSQDLKTSPSELRNRVNSLVEDRRKLEKEIAQLRQQLATGGTSATQAEDVNGVPFYAQVLPNVPANELKPMADALKKKLGSAVIALLSVSEDGKGSAVVGVTDDLTATVSAVELVKVASAAMGGQGGGGRPDMAQAGGPNGADAEKAIEALKAFVAEGRQKLAS